MAWGVSTVNSWYKNATGRIAQNWPFTLLEYWQRTRDADPADYDWLWLARRISHVGPVVQALRSPATARLLGARDDAATASRLPGRGSDGSAPPDVTASLSLEPNSQQGTDNRHLLPAPTFVLPAQHVATPTST